MALYLEDCGRKVDRSSKELIPHGTLDFPCAGYSARYVDREEDAVPWHWHDEMEILYVEEGALRLKIPSATLLLKEGDCAAVNSNILHYCRAVRSCKLHSIVFGPRLITGNDDSAFARKYVRPLASCGSFSGYLVPESGLSEIRPLFKNAFSAIAREGFGFEFVVRENLSRICLFLCRQFERDLNRKEAAPDRDSLRIRAMLAYIHANYSEDITLPDIAKAASIGERECLRCFQRTIQTSPVQYLLKYRAMCGAEMLLGNPSVSISETAALCGFDSPSNFAKIFKRFYDRTPREYRKAHYDIIHADTMKSVPAIPSAKAARFRTSENLFYCG